MNDKPSFGDMPSAGIWKDHPQHERERTEMWRPGNWENPHDTPMASLASIYEAGADAILTCLIKDGILDINKLKEQGYGSQNTQGQIE